MSLQGPFKFMRKLEATSAYAVVDSINISKGGDAFCHVSVYPTPPETKEVEKERIVEGINEKYMDREVDRGPVIEHFSISGIKVDGDPFVCCYKQIRDLDERLVGMSDA